MVNEIVFIFLSDYAGELLIFEKSSKAYKVCEKKSSEFLLFSVSKLNVKLNSI